MEKKTTEKQKVSVKKQQWKPGNMLYPLPAALKMMAHLLTGKFI